MKPPPLPASWSGASRSQGVPPILPRWTQPAKPPPVPPRTSRPSHWKYLRPKELKALKNLLFAARIIVEGIYSGRHKSPYRGSSPEFVDYREYNPGDEIRSIDWKAYARTDRYFIRLFEKETDMNCYLLVDKSASMAYGGAAYKDVLPSGEVSKLDYACFLAAALAYLMVKQGDKVGLALFDTKLGKQIPPGGTFPHLYELLNRLEREKAGQRTSISRVLQEAYPLYKRRGLLIVISDFLDEPEEIFRALNRYRHRRFEIILFQVLHQYEYELPPLDRARFVDAETGETIASRPADIRESYNKEMGRFVQTLSACARARNIDYNLVTTEMPYSDVLRKYLLSRSSR
jgi:uncharacterized protein (DUF58 family)